MNEDWRLVAVCVTGAAAAVGFGLPFMAYLCARAGALGWLQGHYEFYTKHGMLPCPKEDGEQDDE